MTKFVLPRDQRKRKREIYARAHKAQADLTAALRDMREFAVDIKPLYAALGTPDNKALATLIQKLSTLEFKQSGVLVEDLIKMFNTVREDA